MDIAVADAGAILKAFVRMDGAFMVEGLSEIKRAPTAFVSDYIGKIGL